MDIILAILIGIVFGLVAHISGAPMLVVVIVSIVGFLLGKFFPELFIV